MHISMYMTERHNGTDKYIMYAARILRKKNLCINIIVCLSVIFHCVKRCHDYVHYHVSASMRSIGTLYFYNVNVRQTLRNYRLWHCMQGIL